MQEGSRALRPWDGLPQGGPPRLRCASGSQDALGDGGDGLQRAVFTTWLDFGLFIGSVFSEKKEHLLSTYNQEKNRAEVRRYAVSPGRMNHGLPPLLCTLSFLKGFKSSLMHGVVSPCPWISFDVATSFLLIIPFFWSWIYIRVSGVGNLQGFLTNHIHLYLFFLL